MFWRRRFKDPSGGEAPRDIYTRREPTPEELDALKEEYDDPLEIWKRHQWEQRRATIRFFLVTLGFIALIAAILAQQILLTSKPQFSDRPAPGPEPVDEGPKTIPTLIEAHPVYPRLDALFNLPDTEVAPGEYMESDQLKQAAHALVQAEQAFTDQEYEPAADHFKTVLELIPDIRGVAQYLAICHLQLGQHKDAIKGFELALREAPNHPSLLNNIGTAHLSLGEYEPAETHLLNCVRIRPRYFQAHYNLGWLYTQQKNHEAAARHLDILMELNPLHYKGLQLYANALLHLKDFKKAKTVLQEIVHRSPEAPEPRFKLAQCLAETGDAEGAVLHLTAAIKQLDYEAARARLDSPEFARLTGDNGFRKLKTSLDFEISVRAP